MLETMNNFVFSQDPLLYQSTFPRGFGEEPNMKQQVDDAYMKYKTMQEQYKNMQKTEFDVPDKVKELNDLLVNLSPDDNEKLTQDSEYTELNVSLQGLIQEELLNSIKWKINNNPKAEKNISKQIEIIKAVKKKNEEEERKNLNELNDYMKNYSNMTFDEYKRIKNGDNITHDNNNDNTKSKKK